MPMLMRPLGTLFGMRDSAATRERRMLRALWAGVVISLAAFLWGLHYFVRFGRELIGPERAANAALLLAAYPFAVFFNAPYTESLFFLAAVAACYHFRRGEWISSSCWGLLAGLTRPNGCLRQRAARDSCPSARVHEDEGGRPVGCGRLANRGHPAAHRRDAGNRDARLHDLPLRFDRRLVRVGAKPPKRGGGRIRASGRS